MNLGCLLRQCKTVPYRPPFGAAALCAVLLLPFTTQAVQDTGSNGDKKTIVITDYGANGADEKDDTEAVRAAIRDLTANSMLVIPRSRKFFAVKLSASFTIKQPGVRLIFRGRLKATGKPSLGKHLFVVTADNVEFVGEGGLIQGSDEYLFDIADKNGPALIRFAGTKGCSVKNLKLRNAPHFTIAMFGCKGFNITDCVLEGGPKQFKGTQIQGIFFIGATTLLIRGNRFAADSSGGKTYSWIGSSSTSHSKYVTIVGNQFSDAYDHAVYCSGLYNSVIANNTVLDIGGVGIKVIGSNNVIAKNNLHNTRAGGIETRNASRCVISDNVIDQFTHVGIEVSPYGRFSGDSTDILIRGNYLRGMKDSKEVYEGIRISTVGQCSRLKIDGNLLVRVGTKSGMAAISVTSGKPGHAISILGNTIEKCGGDGIYMKNVHGSIIANNILHIPKGRIPVKQENVEKTNLVKDNITR